VSENDIDFYLFLLTFESGAWISPFLHLNKDAWYQIKYLPTFKT